MPRSTARKPEAPPQGELLRAGDPITFIYGIYQIILHTYVTSRDGGGTFITMQLPRTTENIELSSEGYSWVRGHHMIDTPTVQKALRAQACVVVANSL